MRNTNSDFILTLIQKTNQNEVKWEIVKHTIDLPHDEKITSKIYVTTINDKKFRVYEYQYKHYIDEDEWLWNQRKRIEMIDDDNEKLYEFDYDYSVSDLFDSVTRQTSGIDDFLKDFLA
ncbi:hypothetical protein L0669_13365 [Flavobacterium bizetiae]|uniref:hypothetical protein n=1 Tax=Flavobacterium bizetiae TaxID=2704140 RepID=UPI0021E7E88B|nr:hypothetical protein [Flavobacterium bizetiae]UTN02308.1 hypothetical protein L0669_13365 [Flavobacterium bizetiae]